MTPREVVAEVDRLVAELDRSSRRDSCATPTTSSFGTIVIVWQRFVSLVGLLDAAVTSPFADSSAAVLARAGELIGGDAYRLSFWLAHVGEAVAHRTKSPRQKR